MRKDILNRGQDILNWIEEKKSKAYICKELHCKPDTLNSYLLKMGIKYKGNQSGKGYIGHETGNYIPSSVYTNSSSNKYITSYRLKEKLIYDKVKLAQCEICGGTVWNGKPIPLELHHIDGNHYNNKLSNLQILCPNCHAQQDNNSGAANARMS